MTARAASTLAGAALIGTALIGTPAAALPADPFLAMEKLGVLAISPDSGDLDTPIDLTTAGGCPRGTNSITRIYGAGFPDEGENVIGNTEVIQFGSPPEDRMLAPMTITIAEAVRRQPTPPQLEGAYTLRFSCQDALPPGAGGLYGAYIGELTVADGRFTAVTTVSALPDPPAPKAGPEARDAQLVPDDPDVPTVEELEEQARQRSLERQEQDAAVEVAEQGGPGGGWTVPLAVGGGVLFLGLPVLLLYARRPVKTSTGSR